MAQRLVVVFRAVLLRAVVRLAPPVVFFRVVDFFAAGGGERVHPGIDPGIGQLLLGPLLRRPGLRGGMGAGSVGGGVPGAQVALIQGFLAIGCSILGA